MARYLILYIGGDQPSSHEQAQNHFTRYMEWLKSLGEAAVSPMNPVKDTRTVHPDGAVTEGSAVNMSGYSILEAESMEQALALVRSCPFLDINGTLEVSELIDMSG